MSKLLHINSSPMGDYSVSRHLAGEFVQQWRRANPAGEVVTRDLTLTQVPSVTAEWVGAAFTPEESRTDAQREALALSDAFIAELNAADEYVFGVPMHNFTVASPFRLWIDQIVRAGKTFSYESGSPVGLLKNKKANFIIASGGVYGPGTAMASFNFVEPYLRTVFGFLGVTDTNFLAAGGTASLRQPGSDRAAFLQPHIEAIQARFQTAA
jgi:FMN-dependent NADH-azoreductase